jgi:hypothetical protein
MAHGTQVTGAISELTVARALLSNGWEVSAPMVDEVYDLVARDPLTKDFKTIQVKTIRRRRDRNNELVIYATNGKGEPYTPDTCDYLVGVEGDTVYMTECVGIKEYWASDAAASKRWVKFTVGEVTEPTNLREELIYD